MVSCRLKGREGKGRSRRGSLAANIKVVGEEILPFTMFWMTGSVYKEDDSQEEKRHHWVCRSVTTKEAFRDKQLCWPVEAIMGIEKEALGKIWGDCRNGRTQRMTASKARWRLWARGSRVLTFMTSPVWVEGEVFLRVQRSDIWIREKRRRMHLGSQPWDHRVRDLCTVAKRNQYRNETKKARMAY